MGLLTDEFQWHLRQGQGTYCQLSVATVSRVGIKGLLRCVFLWYLRQGQETYCQLSFAMVPRAG
jgi:hypothetical protein